MATNKAPVKAPEQAEAKPQAEAKVQAEAKPLAPIETLKSTYENATENFKGYSNSINNIGSVANETVRGTFNGIMAFDRALLNALRANLDNWVEHGRDLAKTPNLVTIAQKHKDFVGSQVGAVSQQIKELSDVAEEQTKAALAPTFKAVDEFVATKNDKAA